MSGSAETASLFTPVALGSLRLANRVVMAPMSRNRADADESAHALTALYYRQRASAGLIITEATPVSAAGRNVATSPGIETRKQIEGWRQVAAAVHAAGGKIFMQLAHAGRTAPAQPLPPHPDRHDFIDTASVDSGTLNAIAADFARAAANARDAGFDGIEIHAGNGYLIDRFLRDGTNDRRDAYGGSIERRSRFLCEIVAGVAAAWSHDRIGVKLSPVSAHNGAAASDPQAQFGYVAALLAETGIAYLHAVETSDVAFDWPRFRSVFGGLYIANAGYDRDRAAAAIATRYADLVAFGVPYIANPDLVERFRTNAPLNRADKTTFFGGGARGYTDYPTLAESPSETNGGTR